jgi:hypothetical protein
LALLLLLLLLLQLLLLLLARRLARVGQPAEARPARLEFQISLIEKTQIQRDSFQTHRNSFRIQRNGFHPDPLGRDLGEGANHLTRLDDPQGRRKMAFDWP